MSTRRDRAAYAIAAAIWPGFADWPGAALNAPETAESYRIADLVLAEVDRIPDASEMWADDALAVAEIAGRMVDGVFGNQPKRVQEQIWRDARAALDAALSRLYPKTDDGAVRTGEEPTPLATGAWSPGPVVTPPRRFLLDRTTDVSGVSGTGVVAEGCVWSDGSVSTRWTGDHPSTNAWGCLADVLAVHGHGGSTKVRWLDGGE